MNFVLFIYIVLVLGKIQNHVLVNEKKLSNVPESSKLQIQIIRSKPNIILQNPKSNIFFSQTINPNRIANKNLIGLENVKPNRNLNNDVVRYANTGELSIYKYKEYSKIPSNSYIYQNTSNTDINLNVNPKQNNESLQINNIINDLSNKLSSNEPGRFIQIDQNVIRFILNIINNQQEHGQAETKKIQLQQKIQQLEDEINKQIRDIDLLNSQGKVNEAAIKEKEESQLIDQQIDLSLIKYQTEDNDLRNEIANLQKEEEIINEQNAADEKLADIEIEKMTLEVQDAYVDSNIKNLSIIQKENQIKELEDKKTEILNGDVDPIYLKELDDQILQTKNELDILRNDHQIETEIREDIQEVNDKLNYLSQETGHEKQKIALLKVKRRLEDLEAEITEEVQVEDNKTYNSVVEAIPTVLNALIQVELDYDAMFSDINKPELAAPVYNSYDHDDLNQYYGILKNFYKTCQNKLEETKNAYDKRYGYVYDHINGIGPSASGIMNYFNLSESLNEVNNLAVYKDDNFGYKTIDLKNKALEIANEIVMLQEITEDVFKQEDDLNLELKELNQSFLNEDNLNVMDKSKFTVKHWPLLLQIYNNIKNDINMIRNGLLKIPDSKMELGMMFTDLKNYAEENCVEPSVTEEANEGIITDELRHI